MEVTDRAAPLRNEETVKTVKKGSWVMVVVGGVKTVLAAVGAVEKEEQEGCLC